MLILDWTLFHRSIKYCSHFLHVCTLDWCIIAEFIRQISNSLQILSNSATPSWRSREFMEQPAILDQLPPPQLSPASSCPSIFVRSFFTIRLRPPAVLDISCGFKLRTDIFFARVTSFATIMLLRSYLLTHLLCKLVNLQTLAKKGLVSHIEFSCDVSKTISLLAIFIKSSTLYAIAQTISFHRSS